MIFCRAVRPFQGEVEKNKEEAIRWLIALMVLCCDPLAIALTPGDDNIQGRGLLMTKSGLLFALTVTAARRRM